MFRVLHNRTPLVVFVLLTSAAGALASPSLASPAPAGHRLAARVHSGRSPAARVDSLPPLAAPAEVTALVATRYFAPTDAVITDPFRPPDKPYGPGNRGLEYATAPGETIHASADGTVMFAGTVGSHSSVTLRHDDGLATTYSFLLDALVTAGEVVGSGTALGIADRGFHFGAKRGDVYLDPAVLLAASIDADDARAILVPVQSAPGP